MRNVCLTIKQNKKKKRNGNFSLFFFVNFYKIKHKLNFVNGLHLKRKENQIKFTWFFIIISLNNG